MVDLRAIALRRALRRRKLPAIGDAFSAASTTRYLDGERTLTSA
jgi:hypothetical protein